MGFTTSLVQDFLQPDSILLQKGEVLKAWIIHPGEAASFWDEPTIVRLLLGGSIWQAGSPTRTSGDFRTTIRGGFITWKAGLGTNILTDLDALDPEDPGLDWLWWIEVHFQHTAIDTFATNEWDPSGAPHGKIDVKAKRKMELGYGLAGAFKCSDHTFPATPGVAPTGGANIHMSGRVLLLNH